MNFQTTFEELNKLYESFENREELEVAEDVKLDADPITEAAEEEEIEIIDDDPSDDAQIEAETPVDEEEETVAEEPRLVIECSNCGAVVVKAAEEVKYDNETDVADAGIACVYCEATDGYKVLGMLAPFEATEEAPAEEAAVEQEEEITEQEAEDETV